jgi:hypothetical protein
MQVIIEVEDGLAEVVNAPGARQAIEQAVFTKLFQLRDALHDRQSRQAVRSYGYIGTDKV